MEQNELFELLVGMMLRSERQAAADFTRKLLDQGTAPEYIVNSLLEPALVKLGAMWGAEHISLAQAYVAAKIAEEIMLLCNEAKPQSFEQKKGCIVIGNIEDDFHGLGRKIVSIYLRSNGWDVYDLGNDVIASDFVDAAVARNADIIAVSAMMYTTAMNIGKVREELDRRELSSRIRLAVGGAVFIDRPSLAQEVGANGTAPNAFATLDLMNRLLAERV